MEAIYETNKHSVYLLQYHLVLVTKYRRKVIDDAVCRRLREIFEYIAEKDRYRLRIVAFNHDKDHLHILFRAEPKSELTKFINAYKSASSRLIKKEFPQVCEKLWKDGFWSKSFFLTTAGPGAGAEAIERYILEQGKNKK